jgi:mitogen-activated protein kinase organizer 1
MLDTNFKYSKKELSGHKSGVYTVKYSKDGNHLLSGSQDKTVKLWSPDKGLLIRSYEMHTQPILDLAIAEDNAKFASVGLDKYVYLSDSIKGTTLRRFFGHSERVNTVSFNPQETVLVSGSYDCSVRIWDLKSQSLEPIQILKEAKDSITKVLVFDDKIFAACVDGSIRKYDLRMGSLITDYFDCTINSFDISPDQKFFLVSGLDNSIKLFENESQEIVKVFKGLHTSQKYTLTVRYSLDLTTVITSSENGDIALYDLLDSSKNRVLKGHDKPSCGIDIHPRDNNKLVSCGFDGKIIMWNLNQ